MLRRRGFIFLVKSLFIVVVLYLLIVPSAVALSDDVIRTKFEQVFKEVSGAESAGGDISTLLPKLNEAIALLNSDKVSDVEKADLLINESRQGALVTHAAGVQAMNTQHIVVGVTLGILGASALFLWLSGSRVEWDLWVRIRRKLGHESPVIDDNNKFVALCIIALLMVITVYPVLSANRVVERFSELGLLGSSGKLGGYPSKVVVGQMFNLFLYIGNKEGGIQYYRVDVKLDDQERNLRDVEPLQAPIIASYSLVLNNSANTTLPISLSVGEVGVNLRLVFELNSFDVKSSTFKYRLWNQLLLNVTAPG